MDSQKQQSSECAVCGSAAFDLLDGLYFCSDCGTQSQDVREEITDATGEAGESVLYKRLLKSSTKKKGTANEGDSPFASEKAASVSQLEIFQLILQKQCDAMIALGVDPSIKEAVRLIWFHYLRFYGYAFNDSQTMTRTHAPKRKVLPPSLLEERLCSPERSGEKGMDSSDANVPGGGSDGRTPKRRKSIGRPRKKFSDLLSKEARSRRIKEAAKLGASLVDEGVVSSRDGEKTNKKRRREEESSNGRAKRIKLEERDTYDTFPSNDHLFTASQDRVSAESAEGKTSGSESDEELRGVELYLQRRRETQLVTGNPMLAYFSLKYTICLCYLGLLYIEHNMLLSDLVRWTLLNKVPYNNLVSILPRSITTNTNFHAYVAIVPLASNRVYHLSRALHSHLKLPPLPPLHPAPLCHLIIDRLHLSSSFHTLIDRVLVGIHSPSSNECFRFDHRRFDEECLAVVLVLMRIVYRLDDVYEFQQSNLASAQSKQPSLSNDHPTSLLTDHPTSLMTDQPTSLTPDQPTSLTPDHLTLLATKQPCSSSSISPDSCCVSEGRSSSDELSIYPWEDWVVVYLRSEQQRLEKEIPTSQRELEFVSNYRKYVDFCRLEVFQATRPPPMDRVRRAVYNPEYYAKLSEIFRRYHTKAELRSKVKVEHEHGSSSCEDALNVSSINEGEQLLPFTPRQISLSHLLSDPRAPWKDYQPLREQTQSYLGVRHRHLLGVHLSSSLSFLVSAGAHLLDVQPEELYEALLKAEGAYVGVVMRAFKKIGSLMTSKTTA